MTKQEATIRVQKLQARMDTPDAWNIRVWENMGYHYSLEHCGGHITLSESFRMNSLQPSGFYALIHAEKDMFCSGDMFWVDRNDYLDPNEAVAGAVKIALAHVANLVAVTDTFKGLVK